MISKTVCWRPFHDTKAMEMKSYPRDLHSNVIMWNQKLFCLFQAIHKQILRVIWRRSLSLFDLQGAALPIWDEISLRVRMAFILRRRGQKQSQTNRRLIGRWVRSIASNSRPDISQFLSLDFKALKVRNVWSGFIGQDLAFLQKGM